MTTGRALLTRLEDGHEEAVREPCEEAVPDVTVDVRDRIGALLAYDGEYEAPDIDARVAVVTAGTSDAIPAGEAALVVVAGREGALSVVTVDAGFRRAGGPVRPRAGRGPNGGIQAGQ